MNRRWVMVEMGKHADELIFPRLRSVVDGKDLSGITKDMRWNGGGGFKYYQLSESRDWKQFHNEKDMALSLVLEAAEVLKHFQWKNGKEMEDYVGSHKAEIGEELADALYWILLMAHDMDIDVFDALAKKIDKNEAKYPVEKAKGSHKKYNEL